MAGQPPALLQIVREPWRPGSDAAFAAIEGAGSHFGHAWVPPCTSVVITAANTRDDADAARDAAGHDTTVLAVRPLWSFPAAGWMAADPEFWRDSPAFHR